MVIDLQSGLSQITLRLHKEVNWLLWCCQMDHVILGCPEPVAYRKKEKWHKEGDCQLPWLFGTPSLPLLVHSDKQSQMMVPHKCYECHWVFRFGLGVCPSSLETHTHFILAEKGIVPIFRGFMRTPKIFGNSGKQTHV